MIFAFSSLFFVWRNTRSSNAMTACISSSQWLVTLPLLYIRAIKTSVHITEDMRITRSRFQTVGFSVLNWLVGVESESTFFLFFRLEATVLYLELRNSRIVVIQNWSVFIVLVKSDWEFCGFWCMSAGFEVVCNYRLYITKSFRAYLELESY